MSLPRAWDTFEAYLFDIDGTLLQCADAVHYFAFCNALTSVAGFPMNLDGIVAHGNTDAGILRDAFALADIPEDRWRPQLSKLLDQMCAQVERENADLCVNVLPGVRDVLRHLRDKGATLGVATGNLARIGKQKLAAAGLLDLFHFAAWSDPFEYRVDVFHHAVEQARSVVGSEVGILVLGDTPSDILAARTHNLPVISVATGVYSFEELEASKPSLCLHALTELL